MRQAVIGVLIILELRRHWPALFEGNACGMCKSRLRGLSRLLARLNKHAAVASDSHKAVDNLLCAVLDRARELEPVDKFQEQEAPVCWFR
jgi:hypothetical protein